MSIVPLLYVHINTEMMRKEISTQTNQIIPDLEPHQLSGLWTLWQHLDEGGERAMEREWCQPNLITSTSCQMWVMLCDKCINCINIMEVRREIGLYDNCVNNWGKETKTRGLFPTASLYSGHSYTLKFWGFGYQTHHGTSTSWTLWSDTVIKWWWSSSSCVCHFYSVFLII